MPAKEIKDLRQAGRLDEAYIMAKAELEADVSNIWGKRNLSWVLYSQLDSTALNLSDFLLKIEEVKQLNLPETEEMFFDNLSIVIAKAVRAITHEPRLDINKLHQLFDAIKEIPLKRNSKWFSVLFSAMHKGMKESSRYTEFAEWWDFDNFKPEDFIKEKMADGKEIMAIAEQGYIAYAKHLLPKHDFNGEEIFNREKAEAFLPILEIVVNNNPQFQYPAYFHAKLLLALGRKDNILDKLLPFAKKKRNDFWVWEVLSEAFVKDSEKVLACYCMALSCKSPEEMLVGLRQKMAGIFISKQLYKEAKTEIELLVQARNSHGFKIPSEVTRWQTQEWYKNAISSKSNFSFYKEYIPIAESILFSDIVEEKVIVEFVNSDKMMLNFIASESKFGFFKYDRYFKDVKIGEILKVRFQTDSSDGLFKVYTAVKSEDTAFKKLFMKDVEGIVRISEGKAFGFVEDIFIHPAIVSKLKLENGMHIHGKALKTFNKEKKSWGWKLIS
jgi:hypothetical protein